MKNFLTIVALSALIISCGEKKEEATAVTETTVEEALPTQPATPDLTETVIERDIIYKLDANSLDVECQEEKMLCAVVLTTKCTIKPDYEGCDNKKMPRFIFMQDESLNRPTELSFKIEKIKKINEEMTEVHTQSKCNGGWFGLCQGKVIYVMTPKNGEWIVKDIYALGE